MRLETVRMLWAKCLLWNSCQREESSVVSKELISKEKERFLFLLSTEYRLLNTLKMENL